MRISIAWFALVLTTCKEALRHATLRKSRQPAHRKIISAPEGESSSQTRNSTGHELPGDYAVSAMVSQCIPELIAYRVSEAPHMRLVSAPSARAWMLATNEHFANRCLPLLIANQAGWFILNSHTLRVTWTGDDDIASVQVEYLSGSPPYPALSHFGHGLLTWRLPYLFRTPPGYNLLVRGPANWPKEGAYPLEGVVEADWSAATFTMNWKLTRPNHPITFDIDEPICMIVPQRRGDLEAFQPQIRRIGDEPEMRHKYERWFQSRAQFLSGLKIPGSHSVEQGWQKHYFRGVSPDGLAAPEHQTKLKLHDFDECD